MDTDRCPQTPDATTPPSAHTTSVRLDHPRAVAALALGLAHSRLDRAVAVDELARSGSPKLLRDARDQLARAGDTTPPVLARARGLIDEALPDASSPTPRRPRGTGLRGLSLAAALAPHGAEPDRGPKRS